MRPRFFATAAEFRRWLGANHGKAAELLVGFHKVTKPKAPKTKGKSA